ETCHPFSRRARAIEPPISPMPTTVARRRSSLTDVRWRGSSSAMLPARVVVARRHCPVAGPGGAERLEGADLSLVERPPLARREPPVGELADARADEPHDGMADGLAHAPDLAVA